MKLTQIIHYSNVIHVYTGGWRQHFLTHHTQQVWALALKLQRSYTYDVLPYTVSRVQPTVKDQHVRRTPDLTVAARSGGSWHAWKQQYDSEQRAKAATKADSDIFAAAKAGIATRTLHAPRDILYPCPLGCSAPTMPAWNVHMHVLEKHFDFLLDWLLQERQKHVAVPPILEHPMLGQTAGGVLAGLSAAVAAAPPIHPPHPAPSTHTLVPAPRIGTVA